MFFKINCFGKLRIKKYWRMPLFYMCVSLLIGETYVVMFQSTGKSHFLSHLENYTLYCTFVKE